MKVSLKSKKIQSRFARVGPYLSRLILSRHARYIGRNHSRHLESCQYKAPIKAGESITFSDNGSSAGISDLHG